jgi:hypothetical protein
MASEPITRDFEVSQIKTNDKRTAEIEVVLVVFVVEITVDLEELDVELVLDADELEVLVFDADEVEVLVFVAGEVEVLVVEVVVDPSPIVVFGRH